MARKKTAPALTPEPIYNITHAYWAAKAVLSAARLDLFSALGPGGATAAQVARARRLSHRATEMMLNALVGMKLLVKRGDRFLNSPLTATFLVRSSPRYVGFMLRHQDNGWRSWSNLAEIVRTGKLVVPELPTAEARGLHRDFILAMHANSTPRAAVLARHLDLRGRKHLLDLGGAAGTFAIAFCRRHPGLRATVFDRPATRPLFNQVARQEKMQRRLGFIAGDFNTSRLGGPYDVAFLSNIIHSEGPASVQRLFRRVAGVVESGGLIVVADFFLNAARTQPPDASLFSLNMLVRTDEGRSYSAKEVTEWLKAAGFSSCRHLSAGLKSPQSIIVARKL